MALTAAPALKVELAVPSPKGSMYACPAIYEHADGYLHNTYPGNTYTTGNLAQGTSPAPGAGADLGGIDSNVAVRGSLLLNLASNLTLLAQGTYNHYISSSPAYQASVSTINVQDANGVEINNILASNAPAGLQNCQIIKAGACANAPFGPGPKQRYDQARGRRKLFRLHRPGRHWLDDILRLLLQGWLSDHYLGG